MPRLVYLDSAVRDLADIADDIETSTGSRRTALAAVPRLTRHCERIATLPGLLGRRRPELRSDCRRIVAGSYLIFFRYSEEGEPRAVMEIIHVVYGARDLKSLLPQRLRRSTDRRLQARAECSGDGLPMARA